MGLEDVDSSSTQEEVRSFVHLEVLISLRACDGVVPVRLAASVRAVRLAADSGASERAHQHVSHACISRSHSGHGVSVRLAAGLALFRVWASEVSRSVCCSTLRCTTLYRVIVHYTRYIHGRYTLKPVYRVYCIPCAGHCTLYTVYTRSVYTKTCIPCVLYTVCRSLYTMHGR
jgi:hypothetical protein